MHPNISNYISELFYDNRLETESQTINQTLHGNTKYATPGIYFEPVIHFGNQSKSEEEITNVIAIVNALLNNDVYCRNRDGSIHKLTATILKSLLHTMRR